LRCNAEIAAKVMDGEAVMINLTTGIYYSMDKAGGFLWSLIEAGHSVGEMADAVAARYAVDAERARADVERLVEELLAEQIVAVDATRTGAGAVADTGPPAAAYEAPALQIYRDIGDLLALDPPAPGFRAAPWKNPGDGSGNESG
jgi:hypothetical protein